jgi:hypothetical protein
MRLWIARFILDTGCNFCKYELLIVAPDYAEAKKQVYAWDKKYCAYEDNIAFSTLTIDEIDLTEAKVIKDFKGGSLY